MNRERDCLPLLTSQEIDPSLPTGLWFCATPEDAQYVGTNGVCKSLYAQWDELADCTEFLAEFCYVFVAATKDQGRDEIAAELIQRAPVLVLVADEAAFRGNKSVRQFGENYGHDNVRNLLFNAIELPRPGLIDLAGVMTTEELSRNRVMSGFVPLDYCTGGFCGGELSVWTGRRGEGKSTLLGQILVEAVNETRTVCAYSGELPARQFKRSIMPQIAGPKNLTPRPDSRTGRTEYGPGNDVEEEINKWLRGRFLLTDLRQKNAHDEDNILALFEYAYRRYGASVFLADNIMTTQLKMEDQLGQLGAQKRFIQRLSAFAKKNDVCVHLVAHPRKTDRERGLIADDVAGASEITNLADKVFSVERTEAESDARVKIIKDRRTGSRETIPLMFEPKSRRFYDIGGNPDKRYSWEAAKDGHG